MNDITDCNTIWCPTFYKKDESITETPLLNVGPRNLTCKIASILVQKYAEQEL